MAAGSRFACLGLTALALAMPAQAETGRDLATVLAEIDQGFICPRFQPDDAARHAAMAAFSRALASVGPTRITYRQAAYIRAKLLQRHHCRPDSGAIASAEPPAGKAVPAAAAASAN
jgi:hypothetical protein